MTNVLNFFLYAYTFLFGIVVGSFLNVAIHRLPRSRYMGSDDLVCPHCEKEILSISCPHCGKEITDDDPRPSPTKAEGTRSHCPQCGALIRWYDNIPLLSYFVLRGRCRDCRTRISWRYPLVELAAGLFAVAAFRHFGGSPAAAIYFCFLAALIVISFIDLDFLRIPMVITIPGVAVGIIVSRWLPEFGVLASLIGALTGAGGIYLLRRAYMLVRGGEGMGAGDGDLLAMIGAFLGWQGALLTLMAAAVIGMLSGLVLMAARKKGVKLRVPFGPFLACGAMISLFYGEAIIGWYMKFITIP